MAKALTLVHGPEIKRQIANYAEIPTIARNYLLTLRGAWSLSDRGEGWWEWIHFSGQQSDMTIRGRRNRQGKMFADSVQTPNFSLRIEGSDEMDKRVKLLLDIAAQADTLISKLNPGTLSPEAFTLCKSISALVECGRQDGIVPQTMLLVSPQILKFKDIKPGMRVYKATSPAPIDIKYVNESAGEVLLCVDGQDSVLSQAGFDARKFYDRVV